jgi:excisionase family DNA binding protein
MSESRHNSYGVFQAVTPASMVPEVAELAARIPTDQIPIVVASLLLRFWTERNTSHDDHSGVRQSDPTNLLTAPQLAERLDVPESWVRSEERAGRLPSLRLGKYVRFRWAEVERALAKRAREQAGRKPGQARF